MTATVVLANNVLGRLGPVVTLVAGALDVPVLAVTDEAISGPSTVAIDRRRPLAHQPEIVGEVAEGIEPVLVVVGSAAEPAVAGSAAPLVWLETSGEPASTDGAISLAGRARVVIGPAGLAERYDLGKRFVDLAAVTEEAVSAAWMDGQVPGHDETHHSLLNAEAHRRRGMAQAALNKASFPSVYLRERARQRLVDNVSEEASVSACERDGDPGDVCAASLVATPGSAESSIDCDPILVSLAEIRRFQTLAEVVASPVVERLDDHSEPVRSALAVRLIELASDEESLPPDAMPLLRRTEVASVIQAGQVLSLAERSELGAPWLRAIVAARTGLPSAAARLLLARSGSDHEVGSAPAEVVLDTIAGQAVNSSLWHSGHDYWRKVTGRIWSPEASSPPSVPPPRPTELSFASVDEANAQARRLLAIHDYQGAERHLEQVRSMCSAQSPPPMATDAIARLSIGWCRAQLGQPRSAWAPFIESVIREAGPPEELVPLASVAMATLRRYRDGDRLEAQLDELAAMVGSSVTDADMDALGALISAVDGAAAHPGLWESGQAMWSTITGGRRLPDRSSFETPAAHARRPPVGPFTPESVAALDAAARSAARVRRFRRAIELFGRVRIAALGADPPLSTTELAARLNEAHARWRSGAGAERSEALVASVLAVVGPPVEAAALAAEARELAERAT